jgi:phage terminase small subunit
MARPRSKNREALTGHRTKAELANQRPEISIPGEPDRPAGMGKEALEIWDEIVALLVQAPGLLNRVDGYVIADFCEVRANKNAINRAMEKAVAKAIKEAKANKDDQDMAQAAAMIPYQRVLSALRRHELILQGKLGLTPASRSQIKLPSVPIGKKQSSIEEHEAAALDEVFMGGGTLRPV